MKTEVIVSSGYGVCERGQDGVQFTATTEAKEAWFQMTVEFADWERDTFVFLPACTYGGNEFRRIEVTTGELSVPCVGIFYREKKEALFILTGQQVKEQNIGYTVQEGRVEISFPAHRSEHGVSHIPDPDMGISVSRGEELFAPVMVHQTSCVDFAEFYQEFFGLRKAVVSETQSTNGYTEELWNIMEDTFNKRWWKGRWYGREDIWQCAGVENGFETTAFLRKGDRDSYHRAIKSIDYLALPEHQALSGFFYECCTLEGKPCDFDGNLINPEERASHLLRRSADSLVILMKTFELVSPKPMWEKTAGRLADAFVTLFDRYGKFGKTVDAKTGELLIGDGEGAVSAISGLARASAYFDRQEYLDTACKAAEYYYHEFLHKGMSGDGSPDHLCVPDSESAYPLVEGCVDLYEVTGEEKWLSRAETYVHYFSSWVMPYAYQFPKRSEFNRLQINTTGSVFAGAQHKHTSPGIRVASGEGLYRLYRYTGKQAYLELLREIAYFIPQCVSTRKRPIRTYCIGTDLQHRWGACLNLPEGFINDKVNTSDWAGEEFVGNIPYAPGWPELSVLLSFAELMDYPEFSNG